MLNERFRKRRRACDLHQSQLAAKVGIAQSDISRIEAGGWIPPTDIRDLLAAALGTTVDELFDLGEARVAS